MKAWPVKVAVWVAGLATVAPAAVGQVTVIAPKDGAVITLPRVWIRANTDGCNGQPPTMFGYSIDDYTVINPAKTLHAIDAIDQTIPAGPHVIHIKTWTTSGECPRVDIPIVAAVPGNGKVHAAVAPTPMPPLPVVAPANANWTGGVVTGVVSRIPTIAISSGTLEGSQKWLFNHDPDTSGSSQGWTTYPIPGLTPDNTARQFRATYSAKGGEIYHLQFTSDTSATHFIYDTHVMIEDPTELDNLELDMNQVMADGRTVIFGTQCATGSKTWEYTTVTGGRTHWQPSNIACNVQTWPAKTWRHVQIAYERDQNGVVTYDWVCQDDVCSDFKGASGPSAEPLGWAVGHLLLNFQIDGSSPKEGLMTAYVDKLTIYRW